MTALIEARRPAPDPLCEICNERYPRLAELKGNHVVVWICRICLLRALAVIG